MCPEATLHTKSQLIKQMPETTKPQANSRIGQIYYNLWHRWIHFEMHCLLECIWHVFLTQAKGDRFYVRLPAGTVQTYRQTRLSPHLPKDDLIPTILLEVDRKVLED